MTFQIKDFRSIVASMINVTRASNGKITDFSVGSVARTLMEAPAIEIEELYLQMLLGLQEAIPVAIYQAFGFATIDARPSGGTVSAIFPSAPDRIVIPTGTVFEVSGQSIVFKSIQAVVIEAADVLVTLQVVCESAGIVGNIRANAINAGGGFALLPPGASTAHPAFTTGVDAESEFEKKSRFASFISSVARGTLDSIRYCVQNTAVLNEVGTTQEYVTRIGIDEQIGRVKVYVYGSAGLPSNDLMVKIQKNIDGYVDQSTGGRIDGYAPAGVSVQALPMLVRSVSIGVNVATQFNHQNSAELRAIIEAAVEGVILSIAPGADLRADAITSSVLSLGGVTACDLVNNENDAAGQFERLVPGVITVNWIANA